MSKTLLIDYSPGELEELKKAKLPCDFILKETNWKSGKTENLIPPDGCNLVFYKVNYPSNSSGLHVVDKENFELIVKNGGVIVVFAGNCSYFQTTNLIGGVNLNLKQVDHPTYIGFATNSIFNKVFSIYGSKITLSNRFFDEATSESDLPLDFGQGYQVIAVNMQNYLPVAFYKKEGKGFYLYLPFFSDIEEITKFLIEQILTEIKPELFEDKENKWLEKEQYYFPDLNESIKQKNEIILEFEAKINESDKNIEQAKAKQNIFNDLLIQTGEELKDSVALALEYLGFEIIDVDKFFEGEEREKDEDLWVFKSKNKDIKKDFVLITEVKGKKRSASDDDCTTVNRYVARRMREFVNTKMKGLFIFNHYNTIEALKRNQGFSKKQIKDAEHDGNVLITTYTLFKLIKAQKEGKTTKAQIIHKIINEVGEITYE